MTKMITYKRKCSDCGKYFVVILNKTEYRMKCDKCRR